MEQRWKNSVPTPAKNRVVWMFRGRPYWLLTMMGTRMVAPNMANMCWMPRSSILGRPSCRASRMASVFSFIKISLLFRQGTWMVPQFLRKKRDDQINDRQTALRE